MKRLLLVASILVLFTSCVENRTVKSSIKTSNELLVSFFKKYKEQEYKVGNDIQKKELYDKREKALAMNIDSFAILSNLEGEISNITLNDIRGGKSKVLTYNIEIRPEEYFKLKLKCTHIINKDSLDKNYFYNTVKSISNYSTVYFDGIFSVNADTDLPESSGYDNGLSFSYPEYEFYITNIASTPLDTLSNNLIKSIRLGRKSIDYLFKDYRKEKDFKKSIFNQLSDEFDQSKELLTGKEREYVDLYMNSIALDIL